jgi:hypothetical protein
MRAYQTDGSCLNELGFRFCLDLRACWILLNLFRKRPSTAASPCFLPPSRCFFSNIAAFSAARLFIIASSRSLSSATSAEVADGSLSSRPAELLTMRPCFLPFVDGMNICDRGQKQAADDTQAPTLCSWHGVRYKYTRNDAASQLRLLLYILCLRAFNPSSCWHQFDIYVSSPAGYSIKY